MVERDVFNPATRHLRVRIASLAVEQEGLFHPAQLRLGLVPGDLAMRYLVALGELVPVNSGVFRHAAHPQRDDDAVRAAWISTDACALNLSRADGSHPLRAVIGGRPAARLWGFDLDVDTLLWTSADSSWPTDYGDWVLGELTDRDVTIVAGGYQYTGIERTIADAIRLGATPSLVVHRLRQARHRSPGVDLAHLGVLLADSRSGQLLCELMGLGHETRWTPDR